MSPRIALCAALVSAAFLGAAACRRAQPVDSLAVVLAPLPGADPEAGEIARLQEALRREAASPRLLERLGWAFVARARSADDPGFLELAEHAARALSARVPDDAGARLLLGHALASQHRFAEAEAIARSLAAERGLAADHGLLGDALVEQGRLDEAAAAYQAMMDRRPDASAYLRAGHLRWLTGDPDGALEAFALAARAVSPRSRDVFAWTWAALALQQLRAGALRDAERSAEVALAVHPDSVPALLVRGRTLLAQDRPADALPPLARAAARSPMPEVLWLWAEALRAEGRDAEARREEERLLATGERADPRGLALFLASRGIDADRALALSHRELAARQDAVTLAIYAFARARAGDARGAWPIMRRAVAVGPSDPRLHLHAGLVAAAAGRGEARTWLHRAQRGRVLLLPSERAALDRALARDAAPADGNRS
jgi:tetratricopeptide (TPR) repeat protein